MPELTRRQIPWLRISVEGVVIVASVLLALAADAWWDDRQQRQQELAVLRNLRADFGATLSQIERSRSGYDQSAGAAEQLIGLTGPQTPSVSNETIDTLLAKAIDGTAFTPVDATLNALLSSSGLSIISSPTLQAKLAEWPPLLARIRRSQDQNTRLMLDHFMPYLQERVPIRALDRINQPATGTQPSGFPYDSHELLSELLFENGLNDVLFYHRNLSSYMEELRAYVVETLALLDAAIAS